MPTTKTPVISAPITPTEPVVDVKTGKFNFAATQWALNLTRAVNSGLNLIGEFIGNIAATATIGNRTEGIGTTVNHITATGQLDSLTNVAADVNLDHVADTASFQRTTPAQVVGADTAALALVPAASGQALVYSHVFGWGPGAVAYSDVTGAPTPSGDTPAVSHQWLDSYSSGPGTFGQSQPAFTDISGTASAGQIPALSALSGQITTGQLPAAGLSVTIATAKLTGGGADGSMQFQNGILIAQTPAT